MSIKNLIAATKRLAEMDPQAEAVSATVDEMKTNIDLLSKDAEKPVDATTSNKKEDPAFVGEQINKLKAVAAIPAKNYARIYNILSGLQQAVEVAKRPQYASVRPRLAHITEKVAGLFAEVDTVADLDKPLEAIEKAVHSLYGDQSKNGTFYLDRRGKGHHMSE